MKLTSFIATVWWCLLSTSRATEITEEHIKNYLEANGPVESDANSITAIRHNSCTYGKRIRKIVALFTLNYKLKAKPERGLITKFVTIAFALEVPNPDFPRTLEKESIFDDLENAKRCMRGYLELPGKVDDQIETLKAWLEETNKKRFKLPNESYPFAFRLKIKRKYSFQYHVALHEKKYRIAIFKICRREKYAYAILSQDTDDTKSVTVGKPWHGTIDEAIKELIVKLENYNNTFYGLPLNSNFTMVEDKASREADFDNHGLGAGAVSSLNSPLARGSGFPGFQEGDEIEEERVMSDSASAELDATLDVYYIGLALTILENDILLKNGTTRLILNNLNGVQPQPGSFKSTLQSLICELEITKKEDTSDLSKPNASGSVELGSDLSETNASGSVELGSDLSGPNASGSVELGSDLSGPNASGSVERGSDLSEPNASGSVELGSDFVGLRRTEKSKTWKNYKNYEIIGAWETEDSFVVTLLRNKITKKCFFEVCFETNFVDMFVAVGRSGEVIEEKSIPLLTTYLRNCYAFEFWQFGIPLPSMYTGDEELAYTTIENWLFEELKVAESFKRLLQEVYTRCFILESWCFEGVVIGILVLQNEPPEGKSMEQRSIFVLVVFPKEYFVNLDLESQLYFKKSHSLLVLYLELSKILDFPPAIFEELLPKPRHRSGFEETIFNVHAVAKEELLAKFASGSLRRCSYAENSRTQQ